MKFSLSFFFLLVVSILNAQVAINTDGTLPDNSAMLDVKSSGKGILVPRMTLNQRNAIQSPATGLMIFQTDDVSGFYFNSGTPLTPDWKIVGTGSGWGLSGNNGTTAGTDFIGTTDYVALQFRVNNENAGKIDLGSNTSIGYLSLNSITSSARNAAFGFEAMYATTSGNENSAFGYEALKTNTVGPRNVAVGYRSLYYNTTGSDNTATGSYAGYNNTTGTGISAFGMKSLFLNTSGYSNTAVGATALLSNTEGALNTAVGTGALASNITGNFSTAVGAGALSSCHSGEENTALGSNAMRSNNTGSYNIAVGSYAMYSSAWGHDNTVGGNSALYFNTSGSYNTAWGREALVASSSDYNTAVGSYASSSTTSGFQNTSLGANSLVNNTTGSYNTAIGYNTGPNTGNLLNTTTLGIDARSTATDQIRIGNVYINSIGGYANWSNISDGRFKENLTENVPGLSFINQLRPVTYRLNRNAINTWMGIEVAYKGDAMSGITSGFIAQEVEMAAKNIGFDFSGVDAPKNDKDVYALRYADFVVPLVKAVQELNVANEELKHTVNEMMKQNEKLIKRIEMLEAQ